jgi:hypothetical protein
MLDQDFFSSSFPYLVGFLALYSIAITAFLVWQGILRIVENSERESNRKRTEDMRLENKE